MLQVNLLYQRAATFVAIAFAVLRCYDALSPLVIVPGAGGSRLKATLDKPETVNAFCDDQDSDVTLWPSPTVVLPILTNCWVDNARLVYNLTTKMTENSPGVDVTVPGFGGTEKIEFLVDHVPQSEYFNFLVSQAVDEWGYVRGETIRGAPYDFRKSPNEQSVYFADLKQMIEQMYAIDNQKVSLLGHSLGNLYLLYFLQNQTSEWKDKYIRQYFAVAAPFGGSVMALEALVSGYDLHKSVLPVKKLREVERTWPSMTVMLPRASTWGSEPVVASTQKQYTVNDYEALFNDIGYPEGLPMFYSAFNVLDTLKSPGVEVHCIVGTKVNTASSLEYKRGQFRDKKPVEQTEDGDGTVVTRSANLCLKWKTTQSQEVHYHEVSNAEHLKIVMSSETTNYMQPFLGIGNNASSLNFLPFFKTIAFMFDF